LPGTLVTGLQWGDEAKGKIVDILTEKHDIVVRYLGGANAGHTVVHGDETYKLHHIPSGIFWPKVVNVVTGGVVLNPPVVLQEIDGLIGRGIRVDGENLRFSDRTHIIFPWHVAEDRAHHETTKGPANIGTTLRGIGPCYADKVSRTHAIRLGDLYKPTLKERIRRIVNYKHRSLAAINPDVVTDLDAEKIFAEYTHFAHRLKPFVSDTTTYLLDEAEAGKHILFEGAQGALLDVDHGTYPFVTSSNSSAVGVAAGSGVPSKWADVSLGVVKCYSTRVGGGPFPTELTDETGQHIRDMGNEYGTTTGRPRRCGWFDAVAVRYTARLSGIDVLAAMMLDVLSELDEIQICTAYELHGEKITHYPSDVDDLFAAQPVYESLPGWKTDITQAKQYDELPAAARGYLDRISQLVERPVGVVSVGPDRAQTIFIDESLRRRSGNA